MSPSNGGALAGDLGDRAGNCRAAMGIAARLGARGPAFRLCSPARRAHVGPLSVPFADLRDGPFQAAFRTRIAQAVPRAGRRDPKALPRLIGEPPPQHAHGGRHSAAKQRTPCPTMAQVGPIGVLPSRVQVARVNVRAAVAVPVGCGAGAADDWGSTLERLVAWSRNFMLCNGFRAEIKLNLLDSNRERSSCSRPSAEPG
jgi:hypothetical protein